MYFLLCLKLQETSQECSFCKTVSTWTTTLLDTWVSVIEAHGKSTEKALSVTLALATTFYNATGGKLDSANQMGKKT